MKNILDRIQTQISLRSKPEHNPNSPMSVHAMTVAYNDRPVLWDIDYDAPVASLVGVVGPNGAGKSTFIKACLGILPKLSGIVEFWGMPFNVARSRIAYVPQRESVEWDFPISVLEVVCMGLYAEIGLFKRVTAKHKARARRYLELVQMEQFADRQISELSGGQQQRVFLARALVKEADLYFMDEPFSGVDAVTESSIINSLKELKQAGKTVIVVHHDLTTVSEYFDSVILLNSRIIAQGEVSTTFNTENLRKTYGGKLTLLEDISKSMEKLSSKSSTVKSSSDVF